MTFDIYDMDVERQTLATILRNGDAYYNYTELGLCEKDFYVDTYKTIFKAMAKIVDNGDKIDFVTVNNIFSTLSEGANAMEIMREIIADYNFTRNFKQHIKILKDKSLRRQMCEVADEIRTIAYETDKRIDELTEAYEKIISKSDETSCLESISDIAMDVYADIVNAYQNRGQIPGQRTGWSDFDAMVGGLEKGTLTVVGGRPAMGKSIFGQNIGEYVALKEKKPALYFSLEMPKGQVVKRIISSQSNVDFSLIRYGMLNDKMFSHIGECYNTLGDSTFYICDKPAIGVGEIKRWCRQAKRKFKSIGVVIVDYLQLMGSSQRYNTTRAEEVANISRSLKSLAKEMECPVIALAQLSRELERRPNKRPIMADLKESGSIEQDADTIVMLYRDDYYNENSKEKGLCEVSIVKARSGTTGTIKMRFRPDVMKFYGLESGNDGNKDIQNNSQKQFKI